MLINQQLDARHAGTTQFVDRSHLNLDDASDDIVRRQANNLHGRGRCVLLGLSASAARQRKDH
jgi:hypothetical protein